MVKRLSILIALLFCACSTVRPTQQNLAGSYYRGDKLGYNIYLQLDPSGAYRARWEGCLGLYGTARGTWSFREELIIFHPVEETAMMKKHLRQLHVVRQPLGGYVFVPDLQDSYYRQYGPDEYAAFHKELVAHR
jgi:hypothetical protein